MYGINGCGNKCVIQINTKHVCGKQNLFGILIYEKKNRWLDSIFRYNMYKGIKFVVREWILVAVTAI